MKRSINAKNAPSGTSYFSQAILHNEAYTLELSGQIGLNPETGTLVEGIKEQTEVTMQNIGVILAEVGWNYNNIIKTRIFITDMSDYALVNEVYGKFFSEDPPARIALAVKELPLGALVEIECLAAGNEIQSD